MSDDAPDQDLLHALCQEASALVGRLPAKVRSVSLSAGDYQVEITWEKGDGSAVGGAVPVVAAAAPAPAAEGGGLELGDDRHAIVAPLVGTFYRAAEPGAAPFVDVGDVVEAGQDVAIVEAMKVMNRIQADQAGRVVEILVENGEMVEFEQPLLILEPVE